MSNINYLGLAVYASLTWYEFIPNSIYSFHLGVNQHQIGMKIYHHTLESGTKNVNQKSGWQFWYKFIPGWTRQKGIFKVYQVTSQGFGILLGSVGSWEAKILVTLLGL